jgi:hypothetical protein
MIKLRLNGIKAKCSGCLTEFNPKTTVKVETSAESMSFCAKCLTDFIEKGCKFLGKDRDDKNQVI